MKKNKQINIRLTEQEQELLKKTGYKPYEIIKMFLDKFYNTTPIGLSIELELLKKEKDEMLKKEINITQKINDIENRLSNFNDLDLISDSTISLIKITISKYLNKSIQYHNISEFLEDNQDLINVQCRKLDYNAKEYKKLVIEYYNQNYD